MKLVVDCRILSLSYHYGLSRFTAQIVAELYKITPLTVMIYDDRQLKHLPPGIPIVYGPKPAGRNQRIVTKILNGLEPDVVFAPTIFFTAGKRNFNLVISLHDIIGFTAKQPIGPESPVAGRVAWKLYHSIKLPYQSVLNRADHIITVSNDAKNDIITFLKPKTHVSVVYNAPPALKRVSYDHASKTIVYMGAFVGYKNVATLIRAINLLPGYRLVCLSKIHPKTKARLLKLATKPSQVEFRNGVTDDEYMAELSRAAALVTASYHEGFGLPLIEAQTMGIPVVCSDIPVLHEVCGESGALYFEPSSHEQLAEQILQLPAQHNALIAAGFNNVKRFSWQKSAKELYGILQNCATKK